MNDTIRRMKEEIERRGGSVYFPPDAPDEVLEMFLEEVLDCPCCAGEPRRRGPVRKPRLRGH